MEIYWLVLFFITGIIFGSFFNVVGLRVPEGKSFTTDRSQCPACENQLKWYDLFPVLSYLILRGKCRQCDKRIAIIYVLIESATGLLFAYSYIKLGFTVELVTALLLISMLMILFVTDITYMLLPNKILLFFLPLLVMMRIISPLDPWYDALIGAAIGYSVLAAIIILSNGGMGAGDMKLFGVLGLVLGWQSTLLTLFLSSLIGLFGGMIMLKKKKIIRKQPIPFGPSIIVAALVSYFYGDVMIQFYLAFF